MKSQSLQVLVSALTLAGMGGIFTGLVTAPAGQVGGQLVAFRSGEIASAADVNDNFATLQAGSSALQAENSALKSRIEAVEAGAEVLQHVSRVGDDLYITGANLHIVNGAGSTATRNGLGNLIVGYNELRSDPQSLPDERSGSHMVVVGARHNFTSYGGIVAGDTNPTTGPFAAVTGGQTNQATVAWSAVHGGRDNIASGQHAAVGGGTGNVAIGAGAAVGGGAENTASGEAAAVSGGFRRVASDLHAWRAGIAFLLGPPVLGPR